MTCDVPGCAKRAGHPGAHRYANGVPFNAAEAIAAEQFTDTAAENGWLGVKRETDPGPAKPYPTLYRIPRPRPANPYPPGTLAHACRNLNVALAELARESRRAVERAAYRLRRALRRDR
jgi:hypothetical protein